MKLNLENTIRPKGKERFVRLRSLDKLGNYTADKIDFSSIGY